MRNTQELVPWDGDSMVKEWVLYPNSLERGVPTISQWHVFPHYVKVYPRRVTHTGRRGTRFIPTNLSFGSTHANMYSAWRTWGALRVSLEVLPGISTSMDRVVKDRSKRVSWWTTELQVVSDPIIRGSKGSQVDTGVISVRMEDVETGDRYTDSKKKIPGKVIQWTIQVTLKTAEVYSGINVWTTWLLKVCDMHLVRPTFLWPFSPQFSHQTVLWCRLLNYYFLTSLENYYFKSSKLSSTSVLLQDTVMRLEKWERERGSIEFIKFVNKILGVMLKKINVIYIKTGLSNPLNKQ